MTECREILVFPCRYFSTLFFFAPDDECMVFENPFLLEKRA